MNNGYAVLAVNNRGSFGYGKTFYHLDDRRHGEVDLADCVWGGATSNRSTGWTPGGSASSAAATAAYMVAAALAFEPEVFDVGVDVFGVTNWVRTLSSIPPWWGAQRDMLYAELGDPETDLERADGDLAALPRRQHHPTALRGAGRERSAGAAGRER